ncbi:MAG: hypothetical protein GWP47_01840 [Actinobacteria bacterium]|nr:hypothetical protein [Actinomycetota bacterium]
MSVYLLILIAAVSLTAAAVYVRSARLRLRVVRLVEADPSTDIEAHSLASPHTARRPMTRFFTA